MNSRSSYSRQVLLSILLLSLVLLVGCDSQGIYSGTLITEGNHTFQAGELVRGDMYVLGGQTTLQSGARLEGALQMLGGSVDINGEIQGDVSLVGGELDLGPKARVGGNLDVGNGTLTRAPGTRIEGAFNPGNGVALPSPPGLFGTSLPGRIAQDVLEATLASLFALLLARFVPRPLSRVAQAATGHPFVSGALGILVGIVGLSALVLMAFTIILIPVSMLGLILLGLSVLYGWSAMGQALGQRLSHRLNWELSSSLFVFLGTFLLLLLLNLISYLPLLSGVLPLLVSAIGLGAVMLTRFGWRTFVPASNVPWAEDDLLEGSESSIT